MAMEMRWVPGTCQIEEGKTFVIYQAMKKVSLEKDMRDK